MSATPRPPDPQQIRDYLLRRLPEGDRARFESAYFADDALLDRVESEEDQLVSDYVLGKLTESDRHRFESSLLGTPYYRERVETTSRLRQRIVRHDALSRPAAARTRAADEGLFPGRTGPLVTIGLLTVLLIASVASALRLKSELEKATRRALPVSSVAPSGAGVVPVAQTIVFDPSAVPGPATRRIGRPAGAPILLVFPKRLLPPEARQFSVSLLDPEARVLWESGAQAISPGGEPGDVALRLPPGVPPDGRVAVILRPEPARPGGDVACGILDLRDASLP